jgi:bifunctional non-homologous end joining protein LigD
MLATSAASLPEGAEWTYEVKWDGYRTLVRKDGRRVTLLSRNLKDATNLYPTIARAAAGVRAETALLDGEIVALDERGHPSFQALHHQQAHVLVYYAFDLLHLDGRDLLKRPLEERRAALTPVIDGTHILRSEPLPGTPARIEAAVRGLELEGVIAKRAHSVYEPGRRSTSWVKVKFNRRQEFVIGGFKPGGTTFESLLLGYYQGRKLLYASKVRAGLTPRMKADILARIAPLETPRCPFANLPTGGTGHWGEGITEADMLKLHWVKPQVVVEVSFVEWTRDHLLRHAQFLGIRDDKKAREVVREEAPEDDQNP